eukprot:403349905
MFEELKLMQVIKEPINIQQKSSNGVGDNQNTKSKLKLIIPEKKLSQNIEEYFPSDNEMDVDEESLDSQRAKVFRETRQLDVNVQSPLLINKGKPKSGQSVDSKSLFLKLSRAEPEPEDKPSNEINLEHHEKIIAKPQPFDRQYLDDSPQQHTLMSQKIQMEEEVKFSQTKQEKKAQHQVESQSDQESEEELKIEDSQIMKDQKRTEHIQFLDSKEQSPQNNDESSKNLNDDILEDDYEESSESSNDNDNCIVELKNRQKSSKELPKFKKEFDVVLTRVKTTFKSKERPAKDTYIIEDSRNKRAKLSDSRKRNKIEKELSQDDLQLGSQNMARKSRKVKIITRSPKRPNFVKNPSSDLHNQQPQTFNFQQQNFAASTKTQKKSVFIRRKSIMIQPMNVNTNEKSLQNDLMQLQDDQPNSGGLVERAESQWVEGLQNQKFKKFRVTFKSVKRIQQSKLANMEEGKDTRSPIGRNQVKISNSMDSIELNSPGAINNSKPIRNSMQVNLPVQNTKKDSTTTFESGLGKHKFHHQANSFKESQLNKSYAMNLKEKMSPAEIKQSFNQDQLDPDEMTDEVQYFPDIIMTDFMERRRISSELVQINQTLKVVSKFADENLKKQRSLVYPKMVKHQKTIVLDMDETMVKIQKRQYKLPFFNEIISVKSYGIKESKFYLQFRPFLRKMLRILSQNFELIAYTSGDYEYAKSALNAIERNETFFQYRLTKDNCIRIQELNYHAKDLRILLSNRDMKDIVIVDNQVTNFMLQIHNGLPIKEFHGDKNDTVLMSLTKYLMSFKDVHDVRDKISTDFDLASLVEGKIGTNNPFINQDTTYVSLTKKILNRQASMLRQAPSSV